MNHAMTKALTGKWELTLLEEEGVGDHLTVTNDPSWNKLTFETEEPWSGDTETGFGRGGTVSLSPEQVKELVDCLTWWLATMPPSDNGPPLLGETT